MAKNKKAAKKKRRRARLLHSLRMPFVVGIASGIGSAIATESISLFNNKK